MTLSAAPIASSGHGLEVDRPISRLPAKGRLSPNIDGPAGDLTVWVTEEAVAAWHAPVTSRRGGQPVSARHPNSSIAPELMSPLFYLRPGRVEQIAIPFARMMERLTP